MVTKQKQEKDFSQLIADCISEKRDAQHKLFKTFYSKMFHVCYRYASSYEEAQDMLNEGYLKIFSNLTKYKNEGSFEAWMKRVMANAALDYQRKHKSNIDTVDYDSVEATSMLHFDENNAISKISSDELMMLIQTLPFMSRSVFNLYVFEDYSHAEIAEILQIKEGTSHWHLNFARTKLKQLILQQINQVK
jgi:RNA polymerase sigma-70 factor, ECF subfamily